MNYAINILTLIASFAAMEFVAWFSHKYIMHGFLWFLHKDHHNKDHDSVMERNDFFFLFFAIPGILLLLIGTMNALSISFYIGAGITLYGFCYFIVHDIFIHQRIKIFRNSKATYLKALRRAHKMHHKHLGKEQGECFGMLVVPLKYYKEAKNS